MTYILLVTWFYMSQPPSSYQVRFDTMDACLLTIDQLTAEEKRMRQNAERLAAAQGQNLGEWAQRQILLKSIADSPKMTAVCTQISLPVKEAAPAETTPPPKEHWFQRVLRRLRDPLIRAPYSNPLEKNHD
jgi:hypothetical protein